MIKKPAHPLFTIPFIKTAPQALTLMKDGTILSVMFQDRLFSMKCFRILKSKPTKSAFLFYWKTKIQAPGHKFFMIPFITQTKTAYTRNTATLDLHNIQAIFQLAGKTGLFKSRPRNII